MMLELLIFILYMVLGVGVSLLVVEIEGADNIEPGEFLTLLFLWPLILIGVVMINIYERLK